MLTAEGNSEKDCNGQKRLISFSNLHSCLSSTSSSTSARFRQSRRYSNAIVLQAQIPQSIWLPTFMASYCLRGSLHGSSLSRAHTCGSAFALRPGVMLGPLPVEARMYSMALGLLSPLYKAAHMYA
jgi:hypothetical protein